MTADRAIHVLRHVDWVRAVLLVVSVTFAWITATLSVALSRALWAEWVILRRVQDDSATRHALDPTQPAAPSTWTLLRAYTTQLAAPIVVDVVLIVATWIVARWLWGLLLPAIRERVEPGGRYVELGRLWGLSEYSDEWPTPVDAVVRWLRTWYLGRRWTSASYLVGRVPTRLDAPTCWIRWRPGCGWHVVHHGLRWDVVTGRLYACGLDGAHADTTIDPAVWRRRLDVVQQTAQQRVTAGVAASSRVHLAQATDGLDLPSVAPRSWEVEDDDDYER